MINTTIKDGVICLTPITELSQAQLEEIAKENKKIIAEHWPDLDELNTVNG